MLAPRVHRRLRQLRVLLGQRCPSWAYRGGSARDLQSVNCGRRSPNKMLAVHILFAVNGFSDGLE